MGNEKISIDGCATHGVESKGECDMGVHKMFENYSSLQTGNSDMNYNDVIEFGIKLREVLGVANEISKQEEQLIREWESISKSLNKKTMENLKIAFINTNTSVHKKMLNTMLNS